MSVDTPERSEVKALPGHKPKFTRQHYIMVSNVMQANQPHKGSVDMQQHYADCVALAHLFQRDNELFNRNLFLHACGGYK